MTSHPIHLVACIGVKSSPHLISHFLAHYHSLGVRSFLIVLHAQDGDPRAVEAKRRLAQWDVQPVREIEVFSAARKQLHIAAVLRENCGPTDWVIHADIDEFQIYPGSLMSYLRRRDEAGHTFVRGRLVDRLAPDGELIEMQAHPTLWEQFPVSARITRKLIGAWDRKVCAARASVKIADGGSHSVFYGWDPLWDYRLTHYLPRFGEQPIEIHHFKWDATLPQRVREKLEGRGGDVDSLDGKGFMREYRVLDDHLRRFGKLSIPSGRS